MHKLKKKTLLNTGIIVTSSVSFLKNGTGFGEGMPAATVYKNVPCPNAPSGVTGKIYWGDATAQLGDYIGMLAIEYQVLKDAGESTKATMNELYFCPLPVLAPAKSKCCILKKKLRKLYCSKI